MRIEVETAQQMWLACEDSLPADIAICAAAVADWRPAEMHGQKIKKSGEAPSIALVENPDILAQLAHHAQRPGLLIGFAAETENLEENARAKLARKGCDWLVANDVSQGVFGGDENEVVLFMKNHEERLPRMSKRVVAEAIVEKIISVIA